MNRLQCFGCLTFVRKYEIEVNTEAITDKKKFRGCFFFVQNEELRNAFDTYRKIENLSDEGFKTEQEQIRNIDTINLFNIDKKVSKIKLK